MRGKGRSRPSPELKEDSGYRWVDKEPIIDYLMARFRESKFSYESLGYAAGLSATTIRSWDAGKTKSPHFKSVVRVALALGLEFLPFEREQVKPQHRMPSTVNQEQFILHWQAKRTGGDRRE